jgi:hypothetical protein
MVPHKILQDRITRIIAATRFPFINQEDGRETKNSCKHKSYEELRYIHISRSNISSIVILNPDDSIREIGEVEMKVAGNLAEKWRELSEKASIGDHYRKLFIYIFLKDPRIYLSRSLKKII